jgi:hypothetical protein
MTGVVHILCSYTRKAETDNLQDHSRHRVEDRLLWSTGCYVSRKTELRHIYSSGTFGNYVRAYFRSY